MSSDRLQRVKEIFLVARKLPEDERADFLENACLGDRDLMSEVDSLLAGEGSPPGVVKTGGFAFDIDEKLTETMEATRDAILPTRIGPYLILGVIGEGGMGIVYRALQTEPIRREVAVKLIKQGMDTKAVVVRFKAERQALALMEHPNIAKVFDAGEDSQGRPFIVMELIHGLPITDYCDIHKLSVEDRLQLFRPVCRGVEHAHSRGIIHRDLKPSNILVTRIDDQPVPMIIDFGIVKATATQLTSSTLHTLRGQLMGTPGYISPEQAGALNHDVDARTDVYSLGVILYELLAGSPPLDPDDLRQAGIADVLRILREQDPAPPSKRISRDLEAMPSIASDRSSNPRSLLVEVRGDLDWITLKALETDPARRYRSARELSLDLQHHINNETVLARPPNLSYKLRKFIRRRRTALAFGSLALVALFAVGGLISRIVTPEQPHSPADLIDNRLAVMYFKNLADPTDSLHLADIATNLLITDLSESPDLEIVSAERLHDLAKNIGLPEQGLLSGDAVEDLAQQSGSRWMLLGDIVSTTPNLILTSRLVDVGSGLQRAAQRVSGDYDEVFEVIDRLTIAVKTDLPLSIELQEGIDPAISQVTTESLDAYRHYLQGVHDLYRRYYGDAERNLYRAIEIDSTFAMAYYRLANLHVYEVRLERADLVSNALRYAKNATHKERLYIESMDATSTGDLDTGMAKLLEILERYPHEKEAWHRLGMIHRSLGNHEEAIEMGRQTLNLDPTFKIAYNQLAYDYDAVHDLGNALWAINEYIALAPGEANPYDSRADIYARNGMIAKAIESYEQALQIKPDYLYSLINLGIMYVYEQRYDMARTCFQRLESSDDPNYRTMGRNWLAVIPAFRGQLETAVDVCTEFIARDLADYIHPHHLADKYNLRSQIHLELGNCDAAIEDATHAVEIMSAEEIDDVVKLRDQLIEVLARCGYHEAAQEVLEDLRQDIGDRNPRQIPYVDYAAGWIEFSKGNVKEARQHLQLALGRPGVTESSVVWQTYYLLGRCNLELGRLGDAVKAFETMNYRLGHHHLFFVFPAVRREYYLGLAYERSGWNTQAAEKLGHFLEIWRHGEVSMPEITDGRVRLQRLRENL